MTSEGKRPWEQKLEDAGARADTELRRVIAYINDEVVPEVRRDGSRALRAASGELERLAEWMESRSRSTTAAPDAPPSGRSEDSGPGGDER